MRPIDDLGADGIFRLLQGVFGASVVPLSQAIMVDMFSAKDRGKAMAIWGIGILLGPIMGPTVGGFITDHLDWRWVFYINVPIGIVNLALLSAFLKKTRAHAGRRRLDRSAAARGRASAPANDARSRQ